MASPRVFISSTCYDLAEERDSLAEFCLTFGFDTTLSERGDIFYHPDLNTHLSCIRETSNCHLFILIIGGRFGGKYKIDPTKSITNAEYAAAIESNIPSFTFVKQEVLNDHNVWQKNKDQPFVKQIQYPSIEKQEHAEDIFKFIDAVRQASMNNGIFGFRLGKDIQEILRKQWAGMMFEYLQNRSLTKQISITNEALGNLSVVSNKIEELVKSIYRNVDVDGASKAIESIEKESSVEEFLLALSMLIDDEKFILESIYTNHMLPDTWWEFMTNFSLAEVREDTTEDGERSLVLLDLFDRPIQKVMGPMTKFEEIKYQTLSKGYQIFKELPEAMREKIISKYLWTDKDSEQAAQRVEEAERLAKNNPKRTPKK